MKRCSGVQLAEGRLAVHAPVVRAPKERKTAAAERAGAIARLPCPSIGQRAHCEHPLRSREKREPRTRRSPRRGLASWPAGGPAAHLFAAPLAATMANIAANIASPQFGAVMLATLGIGLQVIAHGFRFPGMLRGSVFAHDKSSPAYTQLLEEHKKATGEDKLPSNGYPDMGTGRYAQLLPYKQWLDFANAQRIHVRPLANCASQTLQTPHSLPTSHLYTLLLLHLPGALLHPFCRSTTMSRVLLRPSSSPSPLGCIFQSTPPMLQPCTLWAGRSLHGATPRAPTRGSMAPCCLTLRCWQCLAWRPWALCATRASSSELPFYYSLCHRVRHDCPPSKCCNCLCPNCPVIPSRSRPGAS